MEDIYCEDTHGQRVVAVWTDQICNYAEVVTDSEISLLPRARI